MNILASYLKSKIKNNSQGFTLIELLVAIAMASIVMLGLGTGLVAMISSSNTSAIKNDLKDQLNRAADYINEDLKRSRIAEVENIDVTGDGVAEKVLLLTYFNNIDDATPKKIRYYLQNASNPWRGPKVLMRIQDAEGDGFNNNTPQVLVDSLTENAISSNNFTCSTTASDYFASTTTAAAGAPFTGTGGFQACIKKSQPASGKQPVYSTNIALFGEIKDITGTNSTSEIISVDTDTISRSITPSLDAPVIAFSSSTPTYSLTPNLVWDVVLGAQSYKVYRCSTSDSIVECDPTGTNGALLGSTTSAQYTVTNTPPAGQRNCFVVKAVNIDGTVESGFSNRVCTIINPSAPPTAISNLLAVNPADITQAANSTGAFVPALKWTRQTSAYQYNIYRCQTAVDVATCTPTVSSGNLVSSIIATSAAEFDENVPWYQANNGVFNNTSIQTIPDDNTAFCYVVTSINAQGASTVSNVSCGAIKVAKRLKNNWTPAWQTLPSGVVPQGMSWTQASSGQDTTKYYEVARCTTTASTCTPADDLTTVLIDNGTALTFSELSEPAPNYRFCYSIRGSDDTFIGEFNAPQCGAVRPPQCTLNPADFGLGGTKDATKQDASTEAKRLALRNILTANTANQFTSVFVVNDTSALVSLSFPNKLFKLEADTTTTGSGTYSDLTDSGSTSMPCSRNVRLTWNYPTTITVPTLTLSTPPSPGTAATPVVTWSDVSSTNWTNAATYELRRCTTAVNTATCDATTGSLITPTGTRTYSNTNDTPGKNRSFCYTVRAQQADVIANTTYSSGWATVQCGGPE